jgi:hypothetical protein
LIIGEYFLIKFKTVHSQETDPKTQKFASLNTIALSCSILKAIFSESAVAIIFVSPISIFKLIF